MTDLLGPKNVFCLSRDIFDHSYVGAGNAGRDPWTRFEAWAWLIARANYRPSEIDVRGEIITLGRGQLIITQPKLAEKWNWSLKQVRGFLERLQQLSMIGRETGSPKGSRPTIVTIRNYELYQFLESYLGQPDRQPKGSPRAASNKNNKKNTLSNESIGHPHSDVENAFDAYNETAVRAGLLRALKLTPERRTQIQAMLKRADGLDGWRKVLANVEASAFLCGGGAQGFKADLDWLLLPEKLIKVLEGRYGNGAHHSPASSQRPPGMSDAAWQFRLDELATTAGST